MKLHLSPVYGAVVLWAMVYHTQPNSREVELVANRFFKSKKKAWKWFHRKHKQEDFIQPEAVRVTGFSELRLPHYPEAVCADHE